MHKKKNFGVEFTKFDELRYRAQRQIVWSWSGYH